MGFKSRALQRMAGTETNERTVHRRPPTASDRPCEEDALGEIGVLSYLAKQEDLPSFLIKMYGAFSEGSTYTWLVLEFADGGELFNKVAQTSLCESEVQRYTWQILQGVAYLHSHQIGHRDISLENIMLKKDEVRIVDFGMAVQSHSVHGTALRYFRAVGKNYYRSPECYIPTTATGRVIVSKHHSPGTVNMVRTLTGHLCEVWLPEKTSPGVCTAEFWGYEAQPVDIFAVGVCLFILCYRSPPWEKALLSDSYFSYVYKTGNAGLEELVKAWNKPCSSSTAMDLISTMMQTDPSKRPTASECLANAYFLGMAGEQVSAHKFQPTIWGGG